MFRFRTKEKLHREKNTSVQKTKSGVDEKKHYFNHRNKWAKYE